jgi:hypothetical protein
LRFKKKWNCPGYLIRKYPKLDQPVMGKKYDKWPTQVYTSVVWFLKFLKDGY